ncbi:MAG: hypothetical protein U0903_11570 [Planctomycetales bacterium]
MSRITTVDALEVSLAGLKELKGEFAKRGHHAVARALGNIRSIKNSIPLENHYGTVPIALLPHNSEPLYVRELEKHLIQLSHVLDAMQANASWSIPSGDASDCIHMIEEVESALAEDGLLLVYR